MCQKFLTHSAPSTKTQEALNAINGTCRSGISNATNILECHECGTTEHNGLKMCSGCKKASYCSTECQRKAWKSGHKETCRKIGLERERAKSRKKRQPRVVKPVDAE
mmetsp:Transcript_27761/g.64716  ORF Transcript_27761/g.64716 Transcript_27761/m.64716 type:complete len:107 (+) Transcript_27761:260-580(+)